MLFAGEDEDADLEVRAPFDSHLTLMGIVRTRTIWVSTFVHAALKRR